MSEWSASYRRWSGESVGVWQRRWTIARYGLRLCLAGRLVRIVLGVALFQAVALAAVFVFLGQLATPDSVLIRWLESIGGAELRDALNALTSWAMLYPEICVDGVYRLMFAGLMNTCPMLSLVAVALFVHQLISRDLSSNAIVIYNSKALSRQDYLIGKFAIVALILSLIWIAPVALSWFLGNLLSPDWSFFWHSFPSLLRGVTVGLAAVFTFSCLALGVSALAKRTGAAVAYWILGLSALHFAGSMIEAAHPLLGLIDPFESLSQLGGGIYRLRDLWVEAQNMLPLFDSVMGRFAAGMPQEEMVEADPRIGPPLVALAAFCVAGLSVAYRRSRPS